MKMTRIEAITTIVDAATRDNVSVAIYKRLLRAIPALGLSEEEGIHLLERLEYRVGGQLRAYIAEKL